MGQYTYRKRTFLSPISTGFTSYIYAEAESSDAGEYKQGNYILVLADCKRRIDLEFFLGTARHRRESLAKLDLLINVLNKFREAVKTEAALIDEFQKSEKNGSGKARKTKKAKS